MLVLSRKRDEKIVVTTPEGRRIVFTIVAIRGDMVRTGWEADDDVTVHREEVQSAVGGKWKPLNSKAVSRKSKKPPTKEPA